MKTDYLSLAPVFVNKRGHVVAGDNRASRRAQRSATPRSQLMRIAIHEAGHGIASIAMGGWIKRIQIASPGRPVIREDGVACPGSGALADTFPAFSDHYAETARAQGRSDFRLHNRVLGHAFVLVAGPAAEATFLNRSQPVLTQGILDSGRLDFFTANHLLKATCRPDALPEMISVCLAQAIELFAEPSVWDAVTAVARACLRGTQDGGELTQIARDRLPSELPCKPLFLEGYPRELLAP